MAIMKLKFPLIPNDLEYFDVIKNRQVVESFNKSDIAGKKWRELQLLIGKKCGTGIFNYTMKILSNEQVFKGTVRGINLMEKNDSKDHSLKDEINSLRDKISGLNEKKGSDFSTELLISLTKQGYETQINFLNQQLNEKNSNIESLKKEIEKLNDELDNCYDIIDDLKSKTGINQYLDLLKPFLMKQAGNLKPVTNLKDSDQSDIPKDILEILGMVNWNEIQSDSLDQIITYLKMFIQKLPLKS